MLNPPSTGHLLNGRKDYGWVVLLFVASGIVLRLLGRRLWCQCGSLNPFAWNIWSMHNSQHLIDPYFFTHILHGFLFCALLKMCWSDGSPRQHFFAASIIEAIWEIAENSPFIIERYREVTISLDYFGDSVLNSLMDIFAAMTGFVMAYRLKVWQSVCFFAATEVVLLLTIRDGLVLNIMMLIYPLDAIKAWQMGG